MVGYPISFKFQDSLGYSIVFFTMNEGVYPMYFYGYSTDEIIIYTSKHMELAGNTLSLNINKYADAGFIPFEKLNTFLIDCLRDSYVQKFNKHVELEYELLRGAYRHSLEVIALKITDLCQKQVHRVMDTWVREPKEVEPLIEADVRSLWGISYSNDILKEKNCAVEYITLANLRRKYKTLSMSPDIEFSSVIKTLQRELNITKGKLKNVQYKLDTNKEETKTVGFTQDIGTEDTKTSDFKLELCKTGTLETEFDSSVIKNSDKYTDFESDIYKKDNSLVDFISEIESGAGSAVDFDEDIYLESITRIEFNQSIKKDKMLDGSFDLDIIKEEHQDTQFDLNIGKERYKDSSFDTDVHKEGHKDFSSDLEVGKEEHKDFSSDIDICKESKRVVEVPSNEILKRYKQLADIPIEELIKKVKKLVEIPVNDLLKKRGKVVARESHIGRNAGKSMEKLVQEINRSNSIKGVEGLVLEAEKKNINGVEGLVQEVITKGFGGVEGLVLEVITKDSGGVEGLVQEVITKDVGGVEGLTQEVGLQSKSGDVVSDFTQEAYKRSKSGSGVEGLTQEVHKQQDVGNGVEGLTQEVSLRSDSGKGIEGLIGEVIKTVNVDLGVEGLLQEVGLRSNSSDSVEGLIIEVNKDDQREEKVLYNLKSWEFDGTLEGWQAGNHVAQLTYTSEFGNSLRGVVTGADPQIVYLQQVGINIKRTNTIIVTMATNINSSVCQFYYTTMASPNWAEDMRIDFDIVPDGLLHTYKINTDVTGWQGILKNLRFDPGKYATSGTFWISSITIKEVRSNFVRVLGRNKGVEGLVQEVGLRSDVGKGVEGLVLEVVQNGRGAGAESISGEISSIETYDVETPSVEASRYKKNFVGMDNTKDAVVYYARHLEKDNAIPVSISSSKSVNYGKRWRFVEGDVFDKIWLTPSSTKESQEYKDNTEVYGTVERWSHDILDKLISKEEMDASNKLVLAFRAMVKTYISSIALESKYQPKYFRYGELLISEIDNKVSMMTNFSLPNCIQYLRTTIIVRALDKFSLEFITPYEDFKDDLTTEAVISIKSMLDFILWIEQLILVETDYFASCTPRLATEHIVNSLDEWFTCYEDVPQDYKYLFRWFKWWAEAEKNKNVGSGLDTLNKAVGNMVTYFEVRWGRRDVDYGAEGMYKYSKDYSYIDRIRGKKHGISSRLVDRKMMLQEYGISEGDLPFSIFDITRP